MVQVRQFRAFAAINLTAAMVPSAFYLRGYLMFPLVMQRRNCTSRLYNKMLFVFQISLLVRLGVSIEKILYGYEITGMELESDRIIYDSWDM